MLLVRLRAHSSQLTTEQSSYWLKNSLPFMVPVGSSSCSYEPANGACWFIILFVRTRQSTLSWTRPPRTLIVLWSTLVLSSNVLQDISRSLDLLDFQIKITYASYVLKLPKFTRSQIWATDTLQCHKENMVLNILEQHRQSGLESSIRLGKGNWFTSE